MIKAVAATVVGLTVALAGLSAQRAADPDIAAKGGPLPAGWQVRLDDPKAKPTDAAFFTMAPGFHARTGPAAIFYRPEMTKSGSYEVSATFIQIEPAAHAEAYGVFIGGSDLQGANQKYTYFLVRQDGMFLIKRRNGANTPTITDWKANAAIKKTEGKTQGTNTLTVAVSGDRTRFLVNGIEVGAAPTSQVDASGIVGLRINHNLNVHIASFNAK